MSLSDIFMGLGMVFGNVNAMSMEPLGKVAFLTSGFVIFSTIVLIMLGYGHKLKKRVDRI